MSSRFGECGECGELVMWDNGYYPYDDKNQVFCSREHLNRYYEDRTKDEIRKVRRSWHD